MKKFVHALIVSIGLLLPSFAIAQSAPATMPYHTLWGRLGATVGDTGPAQAIPIDTLFSNFGSITVGSTPVNSGPTNGILFDNAGVLGAINGANNGVLCTDSTGVWATCPARKVLTGATTLYVNETGATANCNGQTCQIGSDAAPNLCTTIALPCATRSHAIILAITAFDSQLKQITIQLSDQTYTSQTVIAANMVGATSGGNAASAQLIIQGNCTTPANTYLNVASNTAVILVGVTSPVSFNCLKIASAVGHGIQPDFGSKLYYSNIIWGPTAGAHILATFGSTVEQEGPETISGNFGDHWQADKGSQILLTGQTITCTGAFAAADAFVKITNGSQFTLNGSTFSGCGSITGNKYLADYTSTFGIGTADPNTLFPGSANGVTTLPSFNMTGLIVGGGGGPTTGTGMFAMPMMNGDCTLNLGLGTITCSGKVAVVKVQKFLASGTYTPSTGLLYAIIECVGGGGAGGGVAGTGGNVFTAGGGGGGSYSRAYASAATIGASKTVTIGAGGTAGTAGANNGNAGGDTSVGSICVGKGGSGGQFSNGSQLGLGGAGGVAGTGDFTPIGNNGGPGFYATVTTLIAPSGFGGNSHFASGATPVAGGVSNGINAGTNSGGGGSGGDVSNSASTASGGVGGSGLVLITEFTNQ